MLALAIALWAEAGLALVAGDQVMQCSMTMPQMQAMGSMTCCPDDDARIPALSQERPPCCSVSSDTERPLGFLVSSQQVRTAAPDVTAELVDSVPSPTAHDFGVWRSADASRFVKPVLELKADLRI
jgi:hypothetical protein